MKILWINPVGTDRFDAKIAELLRNSCREGTKIDVVSLPEDRPTHLEYHSYEGLVVADIIRITRYMSYQYDAVVIGCFYDVGLREAREVSKQAVVTAPCQASLVFAGQLGNRFSVIVGRKKWVPKMTENIHLYGYGAGLASMRDVGLGVHEFQANREYTEARLLEEGRIAVERDGAEVLILGCTIEFGFYETMQRELGVPVIDAVLAPFKLAECTADTALRFGWFPSRKGGSEAPPEEEIEAIMSFHVDDPVKKIMREEK